jgi:hypothetical protein
MSNYRGCLGDYERLEPWIGRCERCGDLHCVDNSYKPPRAECLHSYPKHPPFNVLGEYKCLGAIRFITTREEVVSAFRLGGEDAVWAILGDASYPP